MPIITTFIKKEEYNLFILYGESLYKAGLINKKTDYAIYKFILDQSLKGIKPILEKNLKVVMKSDT